MSKRAPKQPSPHAKGRFQRIVRSKTFIIIGSIILFLLALNFALPSIVKHYVNKTLNEIPEYRGRVADVGIRIWRGAYQIRGIELEKTTGKVPVPFFSADLVDLSVEWSALFDGSLVGEILVRNPTLNFVAGKSEKDSQTGVDKSWQDKVKDLFPLRINRFEIENGEVHFRSFTSKPHVDVFIHNLDVVALNLTNSKDISDSLAAVIDARGNVLEDGLFKAHLDIDPFQTKPTFKLSAEMTHVNLPKINDFLLAFGKFDVESGRFSVYTEVSASKGKFKGYVKPLFENLKVLSWEKDKKDPAKLLWEAIVGGIKDIFTNKEEDRLATVIPFSGSFDEPSPDIWATLANLLRNAFVRAIMPGFNREGAQEK